MSNPAGLPNLLTVDLDEARGAQGHGDIESIVCGLLEALDGARATATFFVPRGVAEGKPEIARHVAECGHEVACLSSAQPARAKPYCASFTAEVDAVKAALENATGHRVKGHRNALFAVNYESEWTYDVLVDRGFDYDSSRVPPKYPDVGHEPVPRSVHAMRRWGGTLLEVPLSTADVLAVRMQLGTTGSIRGLPLPVWSALVKSRSVRAEPLVMHLRASELWRSRPFTRSRTSDRRTIERLARIVARFPFTSVADALPALMRAAPIVES